MSKFLLAGAVLSVLLLTTESFVSATTRARQGDLTPGITPMKVFQSNSYDSLRKGS